MGHLVITKVVNELNKREREGERRTKIENFICSLVKLIKSTQQKNQTIKFENTFTLFIVHVILVVKLFICLIK
jgi:hypothetical protein